MHRVLLGLLALSPLALSPFACAGGEDAEGGGQEICTNGVDDDGDGSTDCAEASCKATHACVPAVPEGWEELGYVVLARWPKGDAEADCPAGYPEALATGLLDPEAPAEACSPCACGDLTGDCQLPDLDPAQAGNQALKISSRACGDAALPTLSWMTVPDGWDGTCHSPDAYLGGNNSCLPGPCNVSITAGAPTAAGSTCAPSGGEAAPYEWGFEAKICGGTTTGAGCEGGAACAVRPEGGATPSVCIAKQGQTPCPDPFTTAYALYAPSELHPATCAACACAAPETATCAGEITIYSDTNDVACTTEVITFAAGDCADLAGNPTVAGRVFEVTSPPSGACTPSGGEVSGAPSLGAPLTVCCLP
jgi:hypothetical protein